MRVLPINITLTKFKLANIYGSQNFDIFELLFSVYILHLPLVVAALVTSPVQDKEKK